MELDDCAFPLLQGMVLTDDPKVGFGDANWCLLRCKAPWAGYGTRRLPEG